jgi:hypothetical protein
MFINLQTTRRDGTVVQHKVAVDNIATVTSHGSKTIVGLKNTSHDLWVNHTFTFVSQAIIDAGKK